MSILYVLIVKSKDEIRQQLTNRDTSEELEKELACVNDQDVFIELGRQFEKDHHLIICDCSKLSIDKSITKVYNDIENYIQNLPHDGADSWTNQQCIFSEAAKKFNMQFYVNGGQPYLNNRRIILDIHKDTRNTRTDR